jgi:DNA-binding MarR family transcriptional regulator
MATRAPAERGVDLMLLLDQASHALTTELTAGLADLGITPRGHCVLTHALPGGLTQSQLAELSAVDKTTMVVTMDELEQAGLARREASRTDRRARLISVTRVGRRKLAQADAIVARIYEDVLSGLPSSEQLALVNGLTRLVGGRLSTPVACERPVRRRRALRLLVR